MKKIIFILIATMLLAQIVLATPGMLIPANDKVIRATDKAGNIGYEYVSFSVEN